MTTAPLLAIALGAAGFWLDSQTIRPGFYEVGSFSGSSMGTDAAIWAARVEGIGAVSLPGGISGAELLVRRQPSDSSPAVAYVTFLELADGWHSVHAANEPGLIGELTRVSHDDYGLVVDRVRRGWVRVIYGYTGTGSPRAGWVRLVRDRVEYTSYDDQIRRHGTWFEQPAQVDLFDRPNGRRIRFPLAEAHADGGPGYSMKVLAIEHDWIEVEVTVPDISGCTGNPKATVERSTRAWVRRHDRRGRYQIGYAPAGC